MDHGKAISWERTKLLSWEKLLVTPSYEGYATENIATTVSMEVNLLDKRLKPTI